MPRFTALDVQEWLKRMGAPGNGAAGLPPIPPPPDPIPEPAAPDISPIDFGPPSSVEPNIGPPPPLPMPPVSDPSLPEGPYFPSKLTLPQPRLVPVEEEVETETFWDPPVPSQRARQPQLQQAPQQYDPKTDLPQPRLALDTRPNLQKIIEEERATIPTPERGFLSKIGDFFTRPGVGAGMTAAGAKMMEAASQPGATALGSLGAGIGAAQELGIERGEAELERQKAAQDAAYKQSQIYKNIREGQEPDLLRGRQQAGINGIIDFYNDSQSGEDDAVPISAAQRTQLLAMEYDEAENIVTGMIERDLGISRGSQSSQIQEFEYRRGLSDEDGKAYDEMAARTGRNPTREQYIDERLRTLGEPGWTYDQGLNDAQIAFMAVQRGIPPVYGGMPYSPGQERAEGAMVDSMTAWAGVGEEGGTRAGYISKMEKLQEIIASVESGNKISGPIAGALLSATDRENPSVVGQIFAAKYAKGEPLNTLDLVRSIVFESLRDTLGPQFTQAEGQRLVAASYNQFLPPEVNARRIKRLMREIQAIADEKDRMTAHWDEHGSFFGYGNEYKFGTGKPATPPIGHLEMYPSDYRYDADGKELTGTELTKTLNEDLGPLSREEAEMLLTNIDPLAEDEAAIEMIRILKQRLGY